jgi:methionyl-tRNA formyltransferase
MTERRVLVFAYHDVGYECLALLLARGVDVIAVFSHEDDPGETIWFKSVAELARARGVIVHTPRTIATPEWIARIKALRPDLIFSFYYRQLIPAEILDLARLGAYNMHGSLLPKYRGRAPVNWAVLRGESQTGATLHVMVRRPDAGDIVDQERVLIGTEDTAYEVFSKVTAAARAVLERQLGNLLAGRVPRRPQDEAQATYFGGRRPEDGRIDWRLAAPEVFNLIRAVTRPYPGAFTDVDGRRFFIWWARPQGDGRGIPGEVLSAAPLTIGCGGGALEVTEWQWDGGTPRRDDAHSLPRGAVLGKSAAVNVQGAQP